MARFLQALTTIVPHFYWMLFANKILHGGAACPGN